MEPKNLFGLFSRRKRTTAPTEKRKPLQVLRIVGHRDKTASLLLAARENRLDQLQRLLDKGADINVQDGGGGCGEGCYCAF